MVPTSKAEDLAPKVRQVLDIILNDILLTRSFDPSTSQEKLIIGLSDYAELVFGPLIYDMVSSEAPNCQLVFQAVDAGNCYHSIEEGYVDLAIGVYGELPDSIHRETLYRERHICLYDDNAMLCGNSISLEQYLDTPHAVVTATDTLETAVDATLSEMGKHRRVILDSSRFLTLRHVLTGRKLLCVMAEMMARIPVFSQQLTMCEPPWPIQDFNVEMLTRQRDQQYGKTAWLKKRITEVIRTHVGETKAG